MSKSLPKFGMFSGIISLNKLYVLSPSLCSFSGTPMTCRLFLFMVSCSACRISLLFFIPSSREPARRLVPQGLASSGVIWEPGSAKVPGQTSVTGAAWVGWELVFFEITWGCQSQQALGWVRGLGWWEPTGSLVPRKPPWMAGATVGLGWQALPWILVTGKSPWATGASRRRGEPGPGAEGSPCEPAPRAVESAWWRP